MPDIDTRKFTLGAAVDAVKDVTTDVSSAASSVTTAATAVMTTVQTASTAADGSTTSSSLQTIDTGDVPKALVMDEWKNRQRMAYIALFSMIIATAGLYFIPDVKRIEQIAVALTWFYGAMGGIVAAFMGFKAWSDRQGK